MSTQPNALRLAGLVDHGSDSTFIERQIAAELRAQHELIQKLKAALSALLDRDHANTCQHENTHRGGVIWEICDDCGAMWADDRGGKPEWKDPQEWVNACAALAAAEAHK